MLFISPAERGFLTNKKGMEESFFGRSTDYGYVTVPLDDSNWYRKGDTLPNRCTTLLELGELNSNVPLNRTIEEYLGLPFIPPGSSLKQYWFWLNTFYVTKFDCVVNVL